MTTPFNDIGTIILTMFPKASINYTRGDSEKGIYTLEQQYETIEWIDTYNPENPNNLILQGAHENPTITNRPTLSQIETRRLELLKNEICKSVDDLMTQKIEAASVLYGEHEYNADRNSKIFIYGASSNGDTIRNYKDKYNTVVALAKSDFVSLSGLCLDCEAAHNAKRDQITAEILAAENPEAIDYTIGWPQNPYGV